MQELHRATCIVHSMVQSHSIRNTKEKYRSFCRLMRRCYSQRERAKMIEISKKQAREIALSVYSDIAEYIANHQEEYLAFLEEEKKGGDAA